MRRVYVTGEVVSDPKEGKIFQHNCHARVSLNVGEILYLWPRSPWNGRSY